MSHDEDAEEEAGRGLVRGGFPATSGCAVDFEAGGHPALHEICGGISVVQAEVALLRVAAWDHRNVALHVQDYGHGITPGSVSNLRAEAEGTEGRKLCQ